MSNEKQSLSAGRWRTLAPLAVRRSHPATAVYKDKIYIFGGGADRFESLNSVVAYDPATDSWETCRDMPTRRSGTVAATVGDQIYVMAGGVKQPTGTFKFLNTLERYSPDADHWETGPELLMPHDYPAAALLDGAIYVMGGHHPDATQGGPKTDPGLDFCERFDLASGRWQAIAPLNTPRFALSAALSRGQILAMGGVAFLNGAFDNFTLVERYDPGADLWVEDATMSLPWPAAGQGSCNVGDRIFIFGGYSYDNIHTRAACFDPANGEWHQIPSMPSPRAAMGVAVIDRTVYLFGGWHDDSRTPVDTVIAYTVPE
jgi:N-acetylneuraminic acid mutarotase